MTRRALLPALVAVSSLLGVPGCDCGHRRERADEHPTKTKALDEEPPPPARAKEHTPAPNDRRFGTASITFTKVDGRPHAEIKIAIPEGAGVAEGATQPAAVYFDQGPPIAASLTAREGVWHSSDLRLPPPVESAARAIVKIPTVPQTTFVFEMSGAWQTAESGPVTLEAGR